MMQYNFYHKPFRVYSPRTLELGFIISHCPKLGKQKVPFENLSLHVLLFNTQISNVRIKKKSLSKQNALYGHDVVIFQSPKNNMLPQY